MGEKKSSNAMLENENQRLRERVAALEAELEVRQQVREELQCRVEERTGQLSEANEQLRREIKEREQAEEKLEVFMWFVESSGEGMGWSALDGVIKYANPTLCHMLDGSADEVLGAPVQERYSPETQRRLGKEVFPEVLEGGIWQGEMELHSLKGRVTPTMNSLFVLRDESGNPRWFANVVTDLTDRKRAEAELKKHSDHLEELVAERTKDLVAVNNKLQQQISERRRAEKAFRQSEEKYRLHFVNVSDVIYSIAIDGTILDVSPSVEKVLGYTPDELIGRLFTELNLISEASLEMALLDTVKVFSGESLDAREYEFINKDGSKRWGEVSGSPVIIDDEIIATISVARDITERKRMEREKEHLESELQQSQKMEAIGRLAGGVAHDFNNILTGISGYAELVQSALKSNDPLYADIAEIRKGSDRAAALTDQLLAFSRRQIVSPKVLAISDVVIHSEKMLRRIIGEDIEMIVEAEKDLWRVKTDPGQIDQILVNLAVNSRDAMLGGGKLIIEVTNLSVDEAYCRAHHESTLGDHVMLSVSDNGSGMDEETRQRIFEPFFTTKPRGAGTGLGLSTVYGIVKQNRGFLNVYSEPGIGTTFKIFFPRAYEEADVKKRLASVVPRGTETIFLVEDEQMVRRLARRILQKQGYKIIEASEGGAALLTSESYDSEIHLLLTDVVMPQMSGKELFERLVSDRPRMKVLYMSGYTENAIAHHGVLEHGTEFLQKPFTVGSLSRRVREVLDR